MKKFITTIFLVAYFVTLFNATIQWLYRIDKLADWNFLKKWITNYGKYGRKKIRHKGCCNDEKRLNKVDTERGFTPCLGFFKYPFHPFQNTFLDKKNIYILNQVIVYPLANPPPFYLPYLFILIIQF